MRTENTTTSAYSKGVFLSVVAPLSGPWRRDWERVLAAVNPEHVEVWLDYLPSRTEISELISVLDGMAVVVHGPFIGMSFATPWEDLARISIERAQRALQVAAELNAQVVTFHAGTYPAVEERDRVLDRLARRLETLIDKHVVPLVTVENMPNRRGASREALTTTRDLNTLATYLESVRFTLDIGHCLQNADDHLGFLLSGSARVANIHLHDGFCGGVAHQALGAGELHLGRLISALYSISYSAYVGIETLGLTDTKKSWDVLLTEEARLRCLAA